MRRRDGASVINGGISAMRCGDNRIGRIRRATRLKASRILGACLAVREEVSGEFLGEETQWNMEIAATMKDKMCSIL